MEMSNYTVQSVASLRDNRLVSSVKECCPSSVETEGIKTIVRTYEIGITRLIHVEMYLVFPHLCTPESVISIFSIPCQRNTPRLKLKK